MMPYYLTEAQVLRALDYYTQSAIREAEERELLVSPSPRGGEQDIIAGSALCLFHAAMESNTSPPSVELPNFMRDEVSVSYLDASTCPRNSSFLDQFNRWTELVPRAKLIAPECREFLERLICNPRAPPALYPQNPSSAWMLHSYSLEEVYQLAHSLRSLASDIASCQTRQLPSIYTQLRSPAFPEPSPTPVGTMPPTPASNGYTPFELNPIWIPGSHIHGSPPNAPGSPFDSRTPTPLARGVEPRSARDNPAGIYSGATDAAPSPSHTPIGRPYIPAGAQHSEPLFQHNPFRPGYRSQSGESDSTGRTDIIANIISSNMPVSDVIHSLGSHGCLNISEQLDLESCETTAKFRGGCSDVYFGKLINGTPVAIKTIFRRGSNEEERKHLKHTARELHIWSKCNHPCVARLLGLAEFRDQIAMVSLWMPNGHLREFIRNNPYVDRFVLCIQVAEGLAYLHSLGVVHGDLKGPNVLISDEGNAVLIDFGNATKGDATLQFTATATNQAMTARWAAPEIVEGGHHSAPGDVYALGMTIFETFTGDVPYPQLNSEIAVLHKIAKNELPDRPFDKLPNTRQGDALWELLLRCWHPHPGRRPSADQVREELETIQRSELFHAVPMYWPPGPV